jgi:hypothetical protein
MPGTVTVGCKIPTGLILQTFNMEDHDEPLFGGGVKTVKRAVKTPHPPVKINGPARYAGLDLPHDIKGGCGLTYGVDADFFAEWLRQNRDEPYVKNGLVFAQQTGKPGEIDAQIKDHRKYQSGMEPLDPSNLPQEFKGKIEKADAPR